MACKECTRLHNEAKAWWRAYLTQKNSGETHNPGDAKLDEVLRLHQLTAARVRVHRDKIHAQDGYVVSFDDLELTARPPAARSASAWRPAIPARAGSGSW